MRISSILAAEKPCLSFEVFPPKQAENVDKVTGAALEIAALRPGFVSVTYGAGGTTDSYTLDIARNIQRMGVPALAHLTCVGASKEGVRAQLGALKAAGIGNLLALRGDIPEGLDFPDGDYTYAAELVREITGFGGFCVGAACYPEGHVECASPALDRLHLKQKVDAGVDFLVTQMCFDNDLLFKFAYQIRELGVAVPLVAGIMPVTNGRQIARICRISGAHLPARFQAILDKYGASPSAMRQAGIIYACEQIIGLLADGWRAVHVYSMNKPGVAQAIWDNLKELL